ncbi:hypothetical protein OIU84_018484 [Salix udensis]|uniref:Ribosomal protein L33 n=1 Tax=Salix udensis TaxID=889485 RepID=A0AAD6KWU1_9ROSI|nr:hypothetical protein OIU84_018484 [Salix udensis]
MGDKKKKTFMFIRLVSAAGTGFFYVKRKSAKKALEKARVSQIRPSSESPCSLYRGKNEMRGKGNGRGLSFLFCFSG